MPLQNLYLYCHVRLPSITVSPCLGAMRNRYYSIVLLVAPNAVHFRSSAREALGFRGPVPRTSKSEPQASRNFRLAHVSYKLLCSYNFKISLLSHVKRSSFIYGKAWPKWAWLTKKSAATLNDSLSNESYIKMTCLPVPLSAP